MVSVKSKQKTNSLALSVISSPLLMPATPKLRPQTSPIVHIPELSLDTITGFEESPLYTTRLQEFRSFPGFFGGRNRDISGSR